MAHIQLVKQTSSGLLLPATPESCDFLHQIKIGEWIHADFKRVRNYAFHKRFFKLLQLGFDYWTPVGGAITPRERELLSGFVDYLCESVGREHTPALSDAAEQYLNTVATRRTRDIDGYPDYYVNMVQQQFAGYFASLAISRVDGAENPTYNIDVVFFNGTSYRMQVPV